MSSNDQAQSRRDARAVLLSMPAVLAAAPNPDLPSRWYECCDARTVVDILFDATKSDDLFALRVAVENGANVDETFDPSDGKSPLESALANRSAKVAAALAAVCDPLGRTASREPYFVIAACVGLDDICETLRARTRPLVEAMRAARGEIG